ncbi:MAG: hypothetical protein SGARI_002745, partial [Bacillariaceae sp.]
MAAGITSGRDLVNYVGLHPNWASTPRRRNAFRDLRERVKEIFAAKEATVRTLEAELDRLLAEIQKQQDEVDLLAAHGNIVLAGRDDDRQRDVLGALDEQYPIFSKMCDQKAYNARIISTGRIDQILQTDFMYRKPLQQAKMIGQTSTILKIDFEYKLPDNVYVYEGVGRCFRPYKSMCTIHNQNNQTVWWKMCGGGEAIDEIEKGLIGIRERQDEDVELIY